MIRRICWLTVVIAAVTAGGADDHFKHDQTRIAADVEALLLPQTHLFLYSLDPERSRDNATNTTPVFHGWTVLGQTEIFAKEDQSALIKSFAQGIRANDGTFANCFNPRHGLRAIVGSSTNDFVICYECLSATAYGFNGGKGFSVDGSPNATFNQYLDKYHLKKAN